MHSTFITVPGQKWVVRERKIAAAYRGKCYSMWWSIQSRESNIHSVTIEVNIVVRFPNGRTSTETVRIDRLYRKKPMWCLYFRPFVLHDDCHQVEIRNVVYEWVPEFFGELKIGYCVIGTLAKNARDMVSTGTSSFKGILLLSMVLRPNSKSAAWCSNLARWTMSDSNSNSVKGYRTSLLVASAMVRIHPSVSWSLFVREANCIQIRAWKHYGPQNCRHSMFVLPNFCSWSIGVGDK